MKDAAVGGGEISIFERIRVAVLDGRSAEDIADILKNTPREAFTSAAEAAKSAAKVSESTKGIAEAEERTAQDEFANGAGFYREWMEKADTPEEREKIEEFFERFRDYSQQKWEESRSGRIMLQSGATRVLAMAALAAAAVAVAVVVRKESS